jgi:uncharacterized SAM-binding protein YcdF (DUF218 family)
MTRRFRRARRLGVALAAAAVLGVLAWIFRADLLSGAGAFLVREQAPSHAEVAVVIRGDETTFDRALKAAELFNAGLAAQVYVSSALDDLAAGGLRSRGVSLRSGRDRIVSVLAQRGVPCDRIVVDSAPPGGGTVGELRRVAAFVKSRGLASAILVTSWFHSRRVEAIAAGLLPQVAVRVVAARGEASERNWWRHRYVALTVAEEYLKLIAYELGIVPGFSDDPKTTSEAYLQPPPSCEAGPPRA